MKLAYLKRKNSLYRFLTSFYYIGLGKVYDNTN